MRLLPLATAAAAVALLTIPHGALASCAITSSPATVTYTDPWGGTFYIVVTGCGSTRCPFAEYIYEETNGLGGLQRHDGFADNTCGHPALADMEIL